MPWQMGRMPVFFKMPHAPGLRQIKPWIYKKKASWVHLIGVSSY